MSNFIAVEPRSLPALPAFLQACTFTHQFYPSFSFSRSLQRHRSSRRSNLFSRPFSKYVPRRFSHPLCSALPIPPSQSLPPSPSLPRTAVQFTDPATQSMIYIVGCVHGSFLSADDVESVLSATSPNAIVLELCEGRLNSLRAAIREMAPNARLSTSLNNRGRRTFSQITKSFRGVPQAMLAVLLDGAYKLQVLSGLDPGIEFVHPIRDYKASHLVCGDAPARDTVDALYRVFVTPLHSARTCLNAIRVILERTLFPPVNGVNLFAVLFQDGRRTRELFRLTLLASAIGAMLFVVTSAATFALDASQIANMYTQSIAILPTTSATSGIPAPSADSLTTAWAIANALFQTVGIGYIAITLLQFLKVLIADRDAIIADNIVNTMHEQLERQQAPVTICAVVGLLHVNGILQAIQNASGHSS